MSQNAYKAVQEKTCCGKILRWCKGGHCVKSVQIRGFFWSAFSRIPTEYGEIRSISHYVKPKFVKKLKQVILDCGTDNLGNDAPDKIISDIISLTNNDHEIIHSVAISGIVPRKVP